MARHHQGDTEARHDITKATDIREASRAVLKAQHPCGTSPSSRQLSVNRCFICGRRIRSRTRHPRSGSEAIYNRLESRSVSLEEAKPHVARSSKCLARIDPRRSKAERFREKRCVRRNSIPVPTSIFEQPSDSRSKSLREKKRVAFGFYFKI